MSVRNSTPTHNLSQKKRGRKINKMTYRSVVGQEFRMQIDKKWQNARNLPLRYLGFENQHATTNASDRLTELMKT